MIAAAGIVGLVAGGVIVARQSDDELPTGRDDPRPPAVAAGLLPWAPRGSLAGDADLIAAATAVWRGGAPLADLYRSDELTSVRPGPVVNVVWAGKIGVGQVVLLQSIDTAGDPAVAQIAEHGDPAVLTLDSVDLLPATLPPALAVTYDGNLNMPSLAPGIGAALLEMLPAPSDIVPISGLWQQRLADQGGQLQLLDVDDGGMTDAFLQLGDPDPVGTPIVLANTTQGRAGILSTLEVRAGELVPETAQVGLRDVPDWGPSGRIQGSEYADLKLAIGQSNATQDAFTATVVAYVTSSLPNGQDVSTRLFAILGADDQPVASLIVVRSLGGTALCSHVAPVATEAGLASGTASPSSATTASTNEIGRIAVVAGHCADSATGFVATIAAGAPGAGAVTLAASASGSGSGSDADLASDGGAAEPATVLRLATYPEGLTDTVVARLVDDEDNAVPGAGSSAVLSPLEVS